MNTARISRLGRIRNEAIRHYSAYRRKATVLVCPRKTDEAGENTETTNAVETPEK